MKTYQKIGLVSFLAFLVFNIQSCKEETTFQYNIDDLTDKYWGIPQILQVSPTVTNPEILAPTIFYKNGLVEFEQREMDYWRIYNARSILIENKAQIWQILNLTSDSLHVNVLTYPLGEFIMECLYTPLQER